MIAAGDCEETDRPSRPDARVQRATIQDKWKIQGLPARPLVIFRSLAAVFGLFLVGGGFAPILLSILAFIAALQIHKPLKFWRDVSPAALRNLFAWLWPWTLIISVVSFVVAVEIAIFGDPILSLVGAETAYSIQWFLGIAMLILAIVALPAANAHDAKTL